MKNAVVTVSYGSGYYAENTKAVMPLARAVEGAFCDSACIHSFVNTHCISALRRQGQDACHYTQAIEAVAEKGFGRVCVVPFLLTSGTVYGDIVKAAGSFSVSAPLMDSESDYKYIAQIYEKIARDSGRDVILIGHGSVDGGNENYARLGEALDGHVHVACLKGKPGFESVLSRIPPGRRILLMPLMIAAGRHAHEEIAGTGKDSWKTVFENRGFDVQVHLEGLGEIPGIQDLFISKAKKAAGQVY